MKGNYRRRLALIGAVASVLAAEQAWGGINFHGSSRITLTHDADVKNAGQLLTTGPISVPRSANLFPVNPQQINNTFSLLGSTTRAVGSLGHVTNSTTASFVLAPGSGISQTDPTNQYPGASSLKYDVDLWWTVPATGQFGPLANGFASLNTAVRVGVGGSAKLSIDLHFLNENDAPLRLPWQFSQEWITAGTFTPPPFTTARALSYPGQPLGVLPANAKLHIKGTIEFQASNADTPSSFDAVRAEFGGTPPTGVFVNNATGLWFDRSLAQQQQFDPNEPGLLVLPNGLGHRAFFSGSDQRSNSMFVTDNVRLGTLDVDSPGSYDFQGQAGFDLDAQQGNAVINIRNPIGVHNIATPVRLADTVEVITEGSSQLNISAPISGAGGVVKMGSGTLIFSAVNSYTGGTILAEGSLLVSNEGGSTGPLQIFEGATLTGSGSVNGGVSVLPGGKLAPGEGIGQMRLFGLALFPSSNIEIEGSGRSFDQIVVSGPNLLRLAGIANLELHPLGELEPGSYPIIDYTGNPLGDLTGKLTLVNPVQGSRLVTLRDDADATAIRLEIVDLPHWSVDANGSWGKEGNWNPALEPRGGKALAGFLKKISAPRTVTLDGDRMVGTVVFDSPNRYTVAPGEGGILSVGDRFNPGAIYVASGLHEISAGLSLENNIEVNVGAGAQITLSGGLKMAQSRTFTKSGAGILTLSGVQSYEPGDALTINGGTVSMLSNPGKQGLGTLSVTIIGSSLVLSSSIDVKELNVVYQNPAGAQTLDLRSPGAPGGFHAVRVYADDLEAAKAQLYGAIVNGSLTGNDGIIDSRPHKGSAIGIARMSDHVLIRSTSLGDVNLDGNVTIADFLDLASHFNQIGTATWQEGDLNRDRSVTIADFLDLASNFNTSYSGEVWAIGEEERLLLEGFAAAHGVPEPGAVGVLAGAAVVLARRRRKITA